MRVVSINVPEQVLMELDRVAAKRRVSRCWMVRELLRSGLGLDG